MHTGVHKFPFLEFTPNGVFCESAEYWYITTPFSLETEQRGRRSGRPLYERRENADDVADLVFPGLRYGLPKLPRVTPRLYSNDSGTPKRVRRVHYSSPVGFGLLSVYTSQESAPDCRIFPPRTYRKASTNVCGF